MTRLAIALAAILLACDEVTCRDAAAALVADAKATQVLRCHSAAELSIDVVQGEVIATCKCKEGR